MATMASPNLKSYGMVPTYQRYFVLPFEKGIEFPVAYLQEHMFFPITLGILYVAIVAKGPLLMQGKRPFDLRLLLVIWNSVLACLHWFVTIRLLPELYYSIVNHSFYYSVCRIDGFLADPVCTTSLGIAVCIKFAVVLDGVILVLKKKPIPFVHSFSHFAYVYGSTMLGIQVPSMTRLISFGTVASYALVYTYLALRAAGHRMSPTVPMLILGVQIAEKAITSAAFYYVFKTLSEGGQCGMQMPLTKLGVAWAISSLVVKSVYFYRKYFVSEPVLEVEGKCKNS